MGSFQTYHLKLMQMLDQHHISCRLTEKWMQKFCNTKYIDALTKEQAMKFMDQLEGSVPTVHTRLCEQVLEYVE